MIEIKSRRREFFGRFKIQPIKKEIGIHLLGTAKQCSQEAPNHNWLNKPGRLGCTPLFFLKKKLLRFYLPREEKNS
jgi:hypothetical protein